MLPRGGRVGRRANQESILQRNVLRNALRPDLISLTCEVSGSHDVDRQRMVHPSGKRTGVGNLDVVTTGQHRDARPRSRREVEHDIGQPATGVNGHNDISGQNLYDIQRTCDEREPSGQPRPTFDERLVQGGGRGRHHGVDDKRGRRRVIEDQHQLGEQPMTGGEIDDATAAKEPPHPASGLPCFVQLLAWKAPGMADGATDSVEECLAWEAAKISIGETPA